MTLSEAVSTENKTLRLGERGLGVTEFVDGYEPAAVVSIVRRIEALGYDSFWVPEGFGPDPFVTLAHVAAHTDTITLATGIANLWLRTPGQMAQAGRSVNGVAKGRFVLGVGVGHRGTMVSGRGIAYDKPLDAMTKYVSDMDAFTWTGAETSAKPSRVLAALGPRMLELARDTSDGAVPNFTTPEHTARARRILGSRKFLCVIVKMVLTNDATAARAVISRALDVYRDPTNYRNSWLRLGFTAAEIDGRTDRFLDSLVPWGSAASIRRRIDEFYDAGADYVCIQPLSPTVGSPIDWRALREFAPR